MGKKVHFIAVFWCTIISSVLLLGVSLFRWTLIDTLTPFLEPLLELVIWGSAIIVLIWSLIYMVITIRKSKFIAAIPFFISLGILMIAFFFPFTKLSINYDFTSNLNERTKIIEQIQSGQLRNNQNIIRLPADSAHLSKGGGEVLYEKYESSTSILFFTFRGILDNFSGFIYRSDDKEPSTDFNSDFAQIIKLRDHWFWASSR